MKVDGPPPFPHPAAAAILRLERPAAVSRHRRRRPRLRPAQLAPAGADSSRDWRPSPPEAKLLEKKPNSLVGADWQAPPAPVPTSDHRRRQIKLPNRCKTRRVPPELPAGPGTTPHTYLQAIYGRAPIRGLALGHHLPCLDDSVRRLSTK
jgi:hypothetical protein